MGSILSLKASNQAFTDDFAAKTIHAAGSIVFCSQRLHQSCIERSFDHDVGQGVPIVFSISHRGGEVQVRGGMIDVDAIRIE